MTQMGIEDLSKSQKGPSSFSILFFNITNFYAMLSLKILTTINRKVVVLKLIYINT